MLKKIHWTNEEIMFLKENNYKLSIDDFSKILNRTPKGIQIKLNKLGFSSNEHLSEIIKCLNCKKEIKVYKSTNRKFCSHNCSASYINPIRLRKNSRKIKKCLNCKKEFKGNIYCSKKCSSIHRPLTDYQYYLNNQEKFCREDYSPKSFKKYILIEQNNKCSICKNSPIWNNKEIVFVLDHVDGNSTNNLRNNLRLVCPNCDSQLDTYKSKNKGKGRFSRRQRYKEGKSF